MIMLCPVCDWLYDDEERWTICPHGPLWADPDDYCLEHDLVMCPFHEKGTDEP
jgi:hypothetical protein